MSIWRGYYARFGDHVHVRLFVGPAEGALGLTGNLTFRHEEFTEFTKLGKVVAINWRRETDADGRPAGEDLVQFARLS